MGQNVGIGSTSPDASAKLDIQSTTSGILIPRMTSAQRTAIASPATGLLVFDSDSDSFWYYDGTMWIELLSDNLSKIRDADDDTWINVETTSDEDSIRFSAAGREVMHIGLNPNRITSIGISDTGQNILIGDSAGFNLSKEYFLKSGWYREYLYWPVSGYVPAVSDRVCYDWSSCR